MTLIEQLQAWLQRPLYESGVALYAGLPDHSAFLLTMLRKGPDAYNQKKLASLLRDALDKQLLAERVKHDSYPAELRDELSRAKQLMDIRQALKERIRTLHEQGAGEDEIKPEAFRILDITDELTAIYGKKKFVDQNGYLPEPPTHDGDSPEDLLSRRNTVRTYISRLNKQIAQAHSDERRAELKTRLAGFQSELHDIEKRLTEGD